MSTAIPLVRVDHLNVTLGGNPILKDIDFAMYPGQIHAITGENGAGKSTLAKVIAGIHQPAFGKIYYGENPVQIRTPKEAIRQGIALIHQEPLIFPDLNVAENVFVGRLPKKASLADHGEAIRRTNKILQQLDYHVIAANYRGNNNQN